METTADANMDNYFVLPPIPDNALEKKYYEIIKSFVLDPNEKVKTFESNLATQDRKLIHNLADQFGGIEHQSKGRGSDRHIKLEKRLSRLKSGTFNPKTQQWESEHQLPAIPTKSDISIVTQNVLFEFGGEQEFNDLIYSEKRVPLLQTLLGETNADIIALQEVMPDFHTSLLKQKWLQQNYHISDITGESVNPGVMLLSKYPIGQVFSYQYTRSRKVFVVCEVFINNRRLVVGVVHLKAGNFQQYGTIRKIQVEETIKIMERFAGSDLADVLVLGDFNFRDEENETSVELENAFIDLWSNVHVHTLKDADERVKKGYTHDVVLNHMAKAISDRNGAKTGRIGVNSRFDRIMFKKTVKTTWKLMSLEMIATEPLFTSEKDELIYASDHYGLKAVVRFE